MPGEPILRGPGGSGFDRIQGNRLDMGAFELDLNISTPLVVSTTNDVINNDLGATDLSLREAVLIANHMIGTDSITFESNLFSNAQTIHLGSLHLKPGTLENENYFQRLSFLVFASCPQRLLQTPEKWPYCLHSKRCSGSGAALAASSLGTAAEDT